MDNHCNCNNCRSNNQQHCEIRAKQQIPLFDEDAKPHKVHDLKPIFKVPVVLAERKLQVVVEADIHLDPGATEIKRVTKNVFLEQVKLVPVKFERIDKTDFFKVKKAKLFVSGFIRKNIEYSSNECQGVLQDRIVNVPFSGFAELDKDDFLINPIIGISDSSKSYFLNDKNGEIPRLDKNFFENDVKYNEQPFGELLGANFFELDFSPETVRPGGSFERLREKIVVDIFLKVLQVQQFEVCGGRILPKFDRGTVD
ncbi:CsxC family protein [Rummeliibacillus sp. JY-2-4R]